MSLELCPSCREVRNMSVSISERVVTGSDGKKKMIRTMSFRCEVCHSFTHSEDYLGMVEES